MTALLQAGPVGTFWTDGMSGHGVRQACQDVSSVEL